MTRDLTFSLCDLTLLDYVSNATESRWKRKFPRRPAPRASAVGYSESNYRSEEEEQKTVRGPGDKRGGDPMPKDLGNVTDNDLKVKVFELACRDDIGTQDRRRMIESIIHILTRQKRES